jgi:putative tricarboxylic transport membrane protein
MRLRRVLCTVAAGGLLTATAACAAEDEGGGTEEEAVDYPTEQLTIMAPAAPGGGWDQTSRTLQQVMETEGLAPEGVEVVNVSGAGGTIGLAQTAQETDPHQLMTMGLVMLGAVLTNDSPATLEDVTPIARLTSEYEILVVPADSEFETLDDFMSALEEDPGSVPIAGGSAGGTDQILAGLLAQAAGADPAQVNYVAFSGGGESLAALLGGSVAAGISGIGEYAAQVEAGELRALGVSAPERLDIIDTPTFMEQDVDVELANWRGMVAPPDLSDEQRDAIVAFFDDVNASDGWQDALERSGWDNTYLAGDEYATFLQDEQVRVTEILEELGLVT